MIHVKKSGNTGVVGRAPAADGNHRRRYNPIAIWRSGKSSNPARS
jgi:hypothetical protein